MMRSELFLGVRKTNGQIGYISEGLHIPEFFELLQLRHQEVNVLVDYSPVIERLHSIHRKHCDESILNSYNSMYNFWLDAKTYSKESLKISKSEELSKVSNSLINELQLRMQKKEKAFYSDRATQAGTLKDIKSDSDIYIDTLLCYMHSKASLEIESFKKDIVLSNYCNFLHDLAQKIFNNLAGESFFKYIAFEKRNELKSYLELTPAQESNDQFLLRILNDERPVSHWSEHRCSNMRRVVIEYEHFDYAYLGMVETLRDLLHKTNSIRKMLDRLKAGNVEWDESDETVMALKDCLNKLNQD